MGVASLLADIPKASRNLAAEPIGPDVDQISNHPSGLDRDSPRPAGLQPKICHDLVEGFPGPLFQEVDNVPAFRAGKAIKNALVVVYGKRRALIFVEGTTADIGISGAAKTNVVSDDGED